MQKILRDNEIVDQLPVSAGHFDLLLLRQAEMYHQNIENCMIDKMNSHYVRETLLNLQMIAKSFDKLEPRVKELFEKSCSFCQSKFTELHETSVKQLKVFEFE